MYGGKIPTTERDSSRLNRSLMRRDFHRKYLPMVDLTTCPFNIVDNTGIYLLWEVDSPEYYKLQKDFYLDRIDNPQPETYKRDMTANELYAFNQAHVGYVFANKSKYSHFLLQRVINIFQIAANYAFDGYIERLFSIDNNRRVITLKDTMHALNIFIFVNRFFDLMNILDSDELKSEIQLIELLKSNKSNLDELKENENTVSELKKVFGDEEIRKMKAKNIKDYITTIQRRSKIIPMIEDIFTTKRKSKADTESEVEADKFDLINLYDFANYQNNIVSLERNTRDAFLNGTINNPIVIDLKTQMQRVKTIEKYERESFERDIYQGDKYIMDLVTDIFSLKNFLNRLVINIEKEKNIDQLFLLAFYHERLSRKELLGSYPINNRQHYDNFSFFSEPDTDKYDSLFSNMKLPLIYTYSYIRTKAGQFSNCMENAILQFLKILHWDYEEMKYRDVLPPSSLAYSYMNELFVQSQGSEERTIGNIKRWTELVTLSDPQIKYRRNGYEMYARLSNFVRVMGILFNEDESYYTQSVRGQLDIIAKKSNMIESIKLIKIEDREYGTVEITFVDPDISKLRMMIIIGHAYFESAANNQSFGSLQKVMKRNIFVSYYATNDEILAALKYPNLIAQLEEDPRDNKNDVFSFSPERSRILLDNGVKVKNIYSMRSIISEFRDIELVKKAIKDGFTLPSEDPIDAISTILDLQIPDTIAQQINEKSFYYELLKIFADMADIRDDRATELLFKLFNERCNSVYLIALVERGAKVNAQNEQGRPLISHIINLSWTIKSEECIRILQSHNVPIPNDQETITSIYNQYIQLMLNSYYEPEFLNNFLHLIKPNIELLHIIKELSYTIWTDDSKIDKLEIVARYGVNLRNIEIIDNIDTTYNLLEHALAKDCSTNQILYFLNLGLSVSDPKVIASYFFPQYIMDDDKRNEYIKFRSKLIRDYNIDINMIIEEIQFLRDYLTDRFFYTDILDAYIKLGWDINLKKYGVTVTDILITADELERAIFFIDRGGKYHHDVIRAYLLPSSVAADKSKIAKIRYIIHTMDDDMFEKHKRLFLDNSVWQDYYDMVKILIERDATLKNVVINGKELHTYFIDKIIDNLIQAKLQVADQPYIEDALSPHRLLMLCKAPSLSSDNIDKIYDILYTIITFSKIKSSGNDKRGIPKSKKEKLFYKMYFLKVLHAFREHIDINQIHQRNLSSQIKEYLPEIANDVERIMTYKPPVVNSQSGGYYSKYLKYKKKYMMLKGR